MKKQALKGTLPAPPLPAHLPAHAQWLAGEGAGSWFVLSPAQAHYHITRYSPTGTLECGGIFRVKQGRFDPAQAYTFIHLSHCAQVRIRQGTAIIELERVES